MENAPARQSYNINKENLNEPGDVISETLMIVKDNDESFDITNYVSEVILFEDIFSNTMMGHIRIKDAANFITKVPLVGTETVTLSFRTPTLEDRIAKSFKIVAINGREFSAGDKEQEYVISFISLEGYIDNVQSLTKKFSGTTDEIIRTIFNDYLACERFSTKESTQKVEMLTSGHSHGSSASFVSCSWSPLKCINWVASRSFGTSSSAPSFLFFETNKGYRLFSIEELIDEQKKSNDIFAEYIYAPNISMLTDPTKVASKYRVMKPEVSRQFGIVHHIAPFTQFDMLESQDFGYHAGTLITQDYTLKTYQEFVFDYPSIYKSFKHVDDNPNNMFPDAIIRNPAMKNIVRTKAYKLHNDMRDPVYEKWMLQRNSLLYDATKFHIEIEVAGRTDVEVGRLVSFLFPKGVEKSDIPQSEDTLDPYISGLYLITAIRHSFALNNHTMHLELMRDSFVKEV